MADYYVLRKGKWFTGFGTGQPGDFVEVTYRGKDDEGNLDPKAGAPDGGIPNRKYIVVLLTGNTKLLAPCPDFCNGGEAPRLNAIDRAIIRAHSGYGLKFKISSSTKARKAANSKGSKKSNRK